MMFPDQAGMDPHRKTAGLLFDKAPADVTDEERRLAKTINFGVLYTMDDSLEAVILAEVMAMKKTEN